MEKKKTTIQTNGHFRVTNEQKPEHTERNQADVGRTCKFYTGRAQLRIQPRTFLMWHNSAVHCTTARIICLEHWKQLRKSGYELIVRDQKRLTDYRMFSDTNSPSVVSSYNGQTTIYTEGNRKYISVELQCGLMTVLKLTLTNSFLVETSYVFTRWYQAPILARFKKKFLRNKWNCQKNTLSCNVKRNSLYSEPHQKLMGSILWSQINAQRACLKKKKEIVLKKWNFTVLTLSYK